MKLLTNRFLAIALLLACHTAQAGEFAPKTELETANGTFRSAAPEPWYGGYGTREFVFSDGQWSLIFTHALDPAMTQRTFVFRTGGPYEIRGPSRHVAGAYHGVFHERYKHVTLLANDAALIRAMGLADCGLSHNMESDISDSGCGSWKPVAQCGEDHDLFAMDETGVYFGVRPRDNDLCTADKLPKALLPVVARF